MNRQYPAIYTDAHGQEQTTLELESNGEFFSMTLRGLHFRGVALDTFYVWPFDQNKEKQQYFFWEQGYITVGPRQPEVVQQALTEYTLQWEMPLQAIQDQRARQVVIYGFFERTSPTAERKYGQATINLKLQIDDRVFEVESDDPTLGPNIMRLQQKLPQGMHLKCCQFCALSQGDLFSSGLLCYRQIKEPFRAIKHQTTRSKVQNPVNLLREKALYVQEIYLCPEFEIDPMGL